MSIITVILSWEMCSLASNMMARRCFKRVKLYIDCVRQSPCLVDRRVTLCIDSSPTVVLLTRPTFQPLPFVKDLSNV